MPSKSAKQHRFMAAAAHNPGFAKKAGVPPSVAKEFVSADQGGKFDAGDYSEKRDAIAGALAKRRGRR